jgi:hypothetical protein
VTVLCEHGSESLGLMKSGIVFSSVLYFNVLTQQLQELIAESEQEDERYT